MGHYNVQILPVDGGKGELAPLPNKPNLQTIQRFEQCLRKMPEQLDLETTHHFADGLYGREIFIPAGCVLTGKIHKGEHLNFLMQGDITVWTEDGMQRLQAPAVIVSKPGTKRVGLAHADTIWVTVHATRETNLDALESELIVPEEQAIELSGDKLCHG
jgi:quercetin dioxygenase-like cupin family protein